MGVNNFGTVFPVIREARACYKGTHRAEVGGGPAPWALGPASCLEVELSAQQVAGPDSYVFSLLTVLSALSIRTYSDRVAISRVST